MTLMDGLELYICIILTIEFWYDYWYNTRENRIKRRKTSAKKDKIVEPAPLLSSSGKKDVALEPAQAISPLTSEAGNLSMEMRDVRGLENSSGLCDKARPQA